MKCSLEAFLVRWEITADTLEVNGKSSRRELSPKPQGRSSFTYTGGRADERAAHEADSAIAARSASEAIVAALDLASASSTACFASSLAGVPSR